MTDTTLATSLTATIADAFGLTTPEREHLGGLLREGLGQAEPATPGEAVEAVKFPVMKTGRVGEPRTMIPWEVAEKAYAVYCKHGGSGQSIKGVAERGGFYEGEMDKFYPAWREEAARAALPLMQESEVNTNGLKPCPICKATPRRNGRTNAGGVLCAQANHRVQTYGRSQEEADAEWNRFTLPAQPAQPAVKEILREYYKRIGYGHLHDETLDAQTDMKRVVELILKIAHAPDEVDNPARDGLLVAKEDSAS
ncbi:hypothetical protein TA3x_000409 [Tundrisphaera sp. TA3]|uniref:hypothetical protein n=1 Tax=Tundrisphaera sp. TA3 TaxID=3435775 RepID=UPI003EBBAD9A